MELINYPYGYQINHYYITTLEIKVSLVQEIIYTFTFYSTQQNSYISLLRVICLIFYFLIFKRFYLFERKRVSERALAEGEGEAFSRLSREPDAGLDPRTLGS